MAANDLLVTIDASTEGLRRQLNAADAAVAKFDKTTKASLGQIDSTMRKVDQSFNTLNKGAGGFNKFGAAAQQAGYQIGDFATQIAGGQNALVALTQQLGQLLGAFGTAGAVIGAGASIAGALAIKFVDTRSASDRFKDGLKGLEAQLEASNELLKETESGLTAVASAFARADEFQQQLIRSNLEESIRKGSAAIRDQAEAIKELTGAQELFGTISGPGGRPSTAIGIIRPTEGLSKDQAFGISEAMRAFEQSDGGLEAAKAFAKAIIDLRAELNGASPAFTKFADQVLVAVEESIKGGKSLEALKRQLATLGQDVPKGVEAFKALAKGIAEADEAAERLRNTARGIVAAYNPMVAATRQAVDKLVALRDAFNNDLISAEDYRAAVAAIRAEHERTKNPLAATLASLKAEADILKKSEEDRKRATRVQAEYNKAVEKGAPATDATRKAIEKEVDAIAAQEKANAAAKKSQDELQQGREKEKRDREALAKQRLTSVADLQSEAKYLADLVVAQGLGEEAVYRVERARKAELEVQRLQLENNPVEKKQIEDLVGVNEDHKRAIDKIKDAQKEAEKAAEKALAEQKKAVEEATREYEKLIDSIANVSQEKLGDALFDQLKGETVDFAEFLKDTILRAVADIAAAMLTRQIVIPIAASVVGAAPGLFGLSGGAAQIAQQAGGSAFGGMNPLSFMNTGGLYNQFAFSGLGQSLGLSASAGAIGAGAFGVSAATAPATLAALGPGGGFGTVAGLSTASTGGAVGAAGLGGAAPALTGLGAALPAIGIGLAALAVLGPMLFGGQPSVGPVGVADFSPGLGRRRAFDVAGIDPFTADNGGNGESLRPIAEAIADLIADSADRFSATINESLRFRVANYGGPEKGSGRAAGFEVNAFINQEAERRVAEGLSQEQAVFEAFKFAIQEAFTFDSATIAEAAANTAATTTEEILADLDFAKNFEALGQALENLGGTVDANTLALAQQTLAIQKQAEDFATANAQPILDAFEKARELFPATRSGEQTRRITERGVFVNEGEGKRDQRFVEEGTDEFDRLTSGSDPLRVVTRIRMVTEEVDTQAEHYAENLERIRQATEIANASVELLVDQVTGEFEPAVRGPFQTALEQGRANIEELATYFDDLNEQILEANEAFPGLNAALIDTNTVITDAMDALRVQLQEDFTDSIQRQMNAAQGLGGINVINDLIDTRNTNATDAASLGLDVNSTAGALFDAQLRQALEGASLADLGKLLSSGQIVDEGARAIVEAVLAEEALAAIRVEEVAGMQELYAATEQFATAAKNNARTLRQAADALLVDPNLSPLSPELRLQEARRQFEEAFALANDADPTDELSQDAIQRLPGLSQTMLEASRAYYGSTEGYLADFNRAQDILNNTALRQESVEQQQLDALRDIEAAIAAAGGSVVGRTPAEQAAASGFNFGHNPSQNQRIYNALVAAGLPTPQGFGGGVSGNLGELRAANPAVDAVLRAMNFANGGAFVNGMPVNYFADGDVFDRATAFGMRGGLGIMGEAGPEAIMPLDRINGRLGVRALMPPMMPANDRVVAVLERRLANMESILSEQVQVDKAVLHENAQLRAHAARANAENAKLNRLLTDRQAAQPRVAYR